MTDLTKTNMRELLKAEMPHRAPAAVHRKIEDYGFIAGVAVVVVYGLGMAIADTLIRLGVVKPASCAVPLPWWLLVLTGLLVAPKMLGRATTGKIWATVAERFPFGKASE